MLKVQFWSPDTCGCSFNMAFDNNVPEHLLPGTPEAQEYHDLSVGEPFFVEYEQALAIIEELRRAEQKVWADTRAAHQSGTLDTVAALKRVGLHREHRDVHEHVQLASVFLHDAGPIQSNINTRPQPKPKTCKHHQHLKSPKHFESADADNKLKNRAMAALETGIMPFKINDVEIPNPKALGIDYRTMWAFDAERKLHISHTHIKTHAIPHPDTYAFLEANPRAILHTDHAEFDWTSCEYNG